MDSVTLSTLVGSVGGLLFGLLLRSAWKKSPLETNYMTESACQKCRADCQAQRLTDRQELREEVRSLGRSIDDLRKTIIDLIREK